MMDGKKRRASGVLLEKSRTALAQRPVENYETAKQPGPADAMSSGNWKIALILSIKTEGAFSDF